jgi:hypothetical protein
LFNKEVHVDEHGVKRAMTIDFTKMSDRQLDFTIEAYGNGGQLAAQTAAIAERNERQNKKGLENRLEVLLPQQVQG